MSGAGESYTVAGHGDAQSDIMGGATITVMVLFLGAVLALIMTLVFLLQTQKRADALAKKLQTSEVTVEEVSRTAAEAQERAAKAERTLKGQRRGNLVSAGLRIWVQDGGERAVITVAQPAADHFIRRFTCYKDDAPLRFAPPGTRGNMQDQGLLGK